jgi:site-specific DNA recombinase
MSSSTSAVIYLRISEDRTDQRAGVTRQREDCERRARERGWTVVAVTEDNDTSAAGKRKRPGFDTMLDHLSTGRAQIVIAWSLDRLQRNRADEVRLYELCKDRGVTISLVNGADLDFTTAGGRLVADQLSSVARYEIELKADRQRRAQAQAAAAGRRVGGRRPFGYEQDGITVREDEAGAVYAGCQALLAGESLAEVARMWNDKGHKTGQDRPFTRSSVCDVLSNPRNAGLRSHVTADDRKAAQGRRVDRLGRVVCKAAWPAIVDEGTWRAVSDILRDPRRRRPPTAAPALLTGVGRCGVCGLTVHSGGATKGQGRVIRCRSMAHVSRTAQPVEEYVTQVVIERLSRADAAELLADDDRPDAGKLREQAVALRTRLDGAAAAYAAGAIELTQLTTITETIKARLTEVESQMIDTGRADVLGPLVGAEDVRAVWDALSVSRRRAVIDLLMTVVVHSPGRGTRTFRPESVQIIWR